MRSISAFTAAFILGGTTFALAQDAPPAPPAPQGQAQTEGAGADAGGEREMRRGPRGDGPRHHMRRGGHGPHGHRGHKGFRHAMRGGTGFEISLGRGQKLEIRCGRTGIDDCVTAAQPLLDALVQSRPGSTSSPTNATTGTDTSTGDTAN